MLSDLSIKLYWYLRFLKKDAVPNFDLNWKHLGSRKKERKEERKKERKKEKTKEWKKERKNQRMKERKKMAFKLHHTMK